MSNKQMKRVRKLKRLFGYTKPMEQTMKKIVHGMTIKQKMGFAEEVDMMIDRKIPVKTVLPDLLPKTRP